MSWLDTLKVKTGIGTKVVKPEVIWVECKGCGEQLYIAEVEKNFKVCPNCDYHFRIDARERVSHLINPGTFVEHDQDLISTDPLKFKDKKKYKDRIRASSKKGFSHDAILTGSGVLGDHLVEACIFEFKFMGGSMG